MKPTITLNSEKPIPLLPAQAIAQDIISYAHDLLSENSHEALKTHLLAIDKKVLETWSEEQQFEVHFLLSKAFFFMQEVNKAYEYAQEALDLANTLSAVEQSKAHYQIATVYGDLGSLQNCLDHVLLSYELSTKDDPMLMNGIGVQYKRRKNYSEAQKWYRRGLEICKDSTDEALLRTKAIIFYNLSLVHFELEDYEQSVSYNVKAIATIPASETSITIKLYYTIVEGYLKLGDLDSATLSFEKGFKLESTLRTTRCIEYSLNRALLFEAHGEYAKAEAQFLECIEQILFENRIIHLPDAYTGLIDLYKTQGEFEKALEFSEKHFKTVIQRLNHDFDRQTNFLLSKVNHDAVKQEREFYRKQSQVLSKDLTKAQARAQTDALTGIHNRSYFDYVSKILFETAQEISQPLSVAIIDLDYFKKVNDTFGHLIGDETLKAAASIMKNVLREEDVVARYGGEEFVVLLHNTPENKSFIIAEKIRVAIQDYDWSSIAEKLSVTASIGICECKDTIIESLSKADKRLYEAKEAGRNRCMAS